MEDVLKRRLIVLIALSIMAIAVWLPELGAAKFGQPDCDATLLCVAFLDVGQGDAIFIQSPSGVQMLIDGGRDQSVLRELGEIMSWNDRDLNYVLMTHPDADHVGGINDVLSRFTVDQIIYTENDSDSMLWATIEEKINSQKLKTYLARRGQRYDLGNGIYLDILFPDMEPSELESNKSSIVAKLIYNDTSFMLTGDSPKSIEEYLVIIEGEHLTSDVLKVGHHGSRTSTAELFLAEVSPEYAVISSGKDNSYGHPHVEVTDALFNAGVETFNTADNGRIIFWSDGTEIYHRQ